MCVVYLAGHPILSDVKKLSEGLLSMLHTKFAPLPECTSRKPGKDEKDNETIKFMKLPDLEKLRADGKVLSWNEVDGEVYCTCITDAENLLKTKGKIALQILTDSGALELVNQGPNSKHLIIQARCSSVLKT